VAIGSGDELSVIETELEEAWFGWTVVVFQEWLSRPVLLCARYRLSEETMGMIVEKRIAAT